MEKPSTSIFESPSALMKAMAFASPRYFGRSVSRHQETRAAQQIQEISTRYAEPSARLAVSLRRVSNRSAGLQWVLGGAGRGEGGLRKGSVFHEWFGREVGQEAQRMHSYRPSSFSRSAWLCRHSFCGVGEVVRSQGSIDAYCA